MRHAFAVINPIAGHGDAETSRRQLEKHAAEAGWTCECYETTGDEDVAAVVRRALDDGCTLLIAVGGDGTVSDVAAGMMGEDVPLGIVPAGTGNMLARDLDLPLDQDEAIGTLFGGHGLRKVDVMQTDKEKRVLLLNLSAGVMAMAVDDTEPEEKRRFGRIAYLWEGLRELVRWRPKQFSLVVDGQAQTVRATEVLVLNSGMLGANVVGIEQDVRIDDGRLDLFVVKATRFLEYVGVVLQLFAGVGKKQGTVEALMVCRKLTIDSGPPVAVQGDGDVIGQTPVTIEVVAGALQVIVPAKDDRSEPAGSEERVPAGVFATTEADR